MNLLRYQNDFCSFIFKSSFFGGLILQESDRATGFLRWFFVKYLGSQSDLCLAKDIWRFSRAGQTLKDCQQNLPKVCHKYLQICPSIFINKQCVLWVICKNANPFLFAPLMLSGSFSDVLAPCLIFHGIIISLEF